MGYFPLDICEVGTWPAMAKVWEGFYPNQETCRDMTS